MGATVKMRMYHARRTQREERVLHSRNAIFAPIVARRVKNQNRGADKRNSV